MPATRESSAAPNGPCPMCGADVARDQLACSACGETLRAPDPMLAPDVVRWPEMLAAILAIFGSLLLTVGVTSSLVFLVLASDDLSDPETDFAWRLMIGGIPGGLLWLIAVPYCAREKWGPFAIALGLGLLVLLIPLVLRPV